MENNRLQQIYDAASRLFIVQGYAQTRIEHIAKAAGVSVGTIYNEFTGKREILHFIIKCNIDPEYIKRDFTRPISENDFTALSEEFFVVASKAQERFTRFLPDEVHLYSFERLISDIFDTIAKYAVAFLFIERNPAESGPIFNRYNDYRGQFISTFMEYIKAFMESGEIRELKYPQHAVVLIVETLSWWCMHRPYSRYSNVDISMEQAKEVVMDGLVSAYKKG